jgi:hypothetical protein
MIRQRLFAICKEALHDAGVTMASTTVSMGVVCVAEKGVSFFSKGPSPEEKASPSNPPKPLEQP